MSDWEQSLDHLVSYLPRDLSHWIVVYEGSFHSEIVSRLRGRLESAEFFDLEMEAGQSIRSVAIANRDNERAGFLEFVIRYPASVYGGDSPGAEGLDDFVFWPQTRTKLCFDVTDNNFCDLFAETPEEVTERCSRLRDRVARAETLFYHEGPGAVNPVTINCAGSEWIAYSGFGQTFDHVLPSGEVACLPKSVDGRLRVDGWIIGTIPFGVKYGRIQRGELELKLENRRIVAVSGTNGKLCADFEGALSAAPRLQRISEVGIGQSLAVRQAAQNHKLGYSWHERHFGLHFGLGAELPREDQSNNPRTGGHHLDIVISTGMLSGSTASEILTW